MALRLSCGFNIYVACKLRNIKYKLKHSKTKSTLLAGPEKAIMVGEKEEREMYGKREISYPERFMMFSPTTLWVERAPFAYEQARSSAGTGRSQGYSQRLLPHHRFLGVDFPPRNVLVVLQTGSEKARRSIGQQQTLKRGLGHSTS